MIVVGVVVSMKNNETIAGNKLLLDKKGQVLKHVKLLVVQWQQKAPNKSSETREITSGTVARKSSKYKNKMIG